MAKAKGQVSPEVTVMQQLSKEGFIAELKRAYRLCQYAPGASTPEPGQNFIQSDHQSDSNPSGMVTRYQNFTQSGIET